MQISEEGPRLTIGMPVYNCAGTIRRAVESLVAQTYRDLRIVISDDASRDGTADVCDEYAARDDRVTVIRQPRNLNYGNFQFLLQEARTPLFMFAAGDDWWHPDYARRMIEALDANPKAVCAVSRVAFMRGDEFVKQAAGTFPLTADPPTNIARFITRPDDNSRMCGVLRTEVAQRAFPQRAFFAFDWSTSVGTLREGMHVEVPEVLLWRDYTEPARYIEYVRRDARAAVDRFFPLFPFTRDVVGRLRIPMTPAVIAALISGNATMHAAYIRRYHPAAAAIYRFVGSAGGSVARGLKRVARRVGAV